MRLEVVHVLGNVSLKAHALELNQTYNVLALVRLVTVALDSLNTAVLALDLVLVDSVLVEAIPSLAVVLASCATLGPCCLFRGHHEVHDIARGIFGAGEARGRSQRHESCGSES
jgi:hypothetical protein